MKYSILECGTNGTRNNS